MIDLLYQMVALQENDQKILTNCRQTWFSHLIKHSGSSTNTPSLTIFYAELSDTGIYTCLASKSDGTGEIDTATLMVSGTVYFSYGSFRNVEIV
jgi:hypothetical protein